MTTTISPLQTASDHAVTTALSAPRIALHLEGAMAFIAGVAAYRHMGGTTTLFAVLFLVPDLSMLGYLGGPRIGAAAYNGAHSYVAPAVLAAFGWLCASHLSLLVSAIWIAHVGLDRSLGYGLKYPTAFRDTHLART